MWEEKGEGGVEVRDTAAGDANSILNICLCSADFRVHTHHISQTTLPTCYSVAGPSTPAGQLFPH